MVNKKPGVITNIGKGAYAVNINGTNEWFNEEDIISMYPKDSVQFYQGNLLDVEFKINQYLIKTITNLLNKLLLLEVVMID